MRSTKPDPFVVVMTGQGWASAYPLDIADLNVSYA